MFVFSSLSEIGHNNRHADLGGVKGLMVLRRVTPALRLGTFYSDGDYSKGIIVQVASFIY